jgi:hypothetical protein
VHVLEELHELRQHPHRHQYDDADRHAHDDEGIGERRLELRPGVEVAFDVGRELFERGVEAPGQLCRLEDAEVVGREDRGVLRQRLGERDAFRQ